MSAPPSSSLHVITLKGFKSKKFLPHHIILASAVQQIKLTHFAVIPKSNCTDSGLELHFPLPEVSLGTSENVVNTASKYKASFLV